MTALLPPRRRVQELSQGRGADHVVAVPLALRSAARIQERDWLDFTEDPTQLANGIRDLVDAVGPDGVPVCSAVILREQATDGLIAGPHARAALEATRRLRASLADRVALVAVLPGPVVLSATFADAAAEQVLEAARQFLAAGADVIVVDDEPGDAPALATLANIARFHQAVAVTAATAHNDLPAAAVCSFAAPTGHRGIVLTEIELPRDTDIDTIEDWLDAVRA